MPTIYQLPIQQPAMVGVNPNLKFAVFGDNLATITAAGYLNSVNLESNPIASTDVLQVLYSFNNVTKVGTYGVFTVSISNSGVITLVAWANPGNVLLPVVSGNIASFNGTTGQIQDSGIAASNLMKLNTANQLSAAGSITANKVNGTEAANAVTASGMAGVITTSALTTAGGASYVITWTNTLITATSSVLITLAGGTNTTENITLKVVPGAGTATLTIYNNTAATALNGTILLAYLVI
jgi:hypothetical protein